MSFKWLRFPALLSLLCACCSSEFDSPEPIQTVSVSAASVSFEEGSDWPQWRGIGRDGAAGREEEEIQPWGVEGPREVWRRPLGEGYSGMAVADGRVYTLFQSNAEYAVALDAATGEEVWSQRIDSSFSDAQGDGPRGTPTAEGGNVYAVGAKGKFVALDAARGKILWSHDLPQEFGASRPTWGYSTSPLIRGNLVYVEPGGRRNGSLAAFDKNNGRLVWSSYSDPAGYSSPILARLDGLEQLLFFTAKHLVSVDPTSGRVFWDHPWRTAYDVNAATPVIIPPNRVFISSNYDVGGAVLEVVGGAGDPRAQLIWKNREMKNHFNTSVFHRGFLYGFDNATLKCIDAANGEMLWRVRGFGKGSLIIAGERLIVLGERGALALVEATPQEYRELARAQVLKGKCWTSPSLAHGKLYLRNQREIVCLDVTASQ